MPLVPLNIPAGVYRNGTDYQASNRWRDSNLVRWHENALRPVGGWRQRGDVDATGTPRGMLAWQDNSSNRYLAFGTSAGLFSMSSGNIVSAYITADGSNIYNLSVNLDQVVNNDNVRRVYLGKDFNIL